MTYLTSLRFKNWAQPVRRRRWATVAVVSQALDAATGWRFKTLSHMSGSAFGRAVA